MLSIMSFFQFCLFTRKLQNLIPEQEKRIAKTKMCTLLLYLSEMKNDTFLCSASTPQNNDSWDCQYQGESRSCNQEEILLIYFKKRRKVISLSLSLSLMSMRHANRYLKDVYFFFNQNPKLQVTGFGWWESGEELGFYVPGQQGHLANAFQTQKN